jgi:hypothetical protein
MTLRHVVLRTLAVAVLAFLASPLPAQDAQPAPVWPKLTIQGLPRRAGEDGLVADIAMTHT